MYFTNFSKIEDAENLKQYLRKSERLTYTTSLIHYTKLENLIKIIESGYWILKTPDKMNDKIEEEYWLETAPAKLNSMFFASFMKENKENIGMWIMYGQPWDDGISISIPKKNFQHWIKNVDRLYRVVENKVFEKDSITLTGNNKPQIVSVTYLDFEKAKKDRFNNQKELLIYNSVENTNFSNIYNNPNLVGYIKDNAWKSEKEARLLVDLGPDNSESAIALKIDNLLDGITITAGPFFNGDLEEKIKNKLPGLKFSVNIKSSMYRDKLQKIPCKECNFYNQKENIK